jgi:hypothetical protein
MLESPLSSIESHEEAIIEQIIAGVEVISCKRYCGFILRYGNKKLQIDFQFKTKRLSTFLEYENNIKENHKPNETTLLYKAAQCIMQNLADCRQEELPYYVDTTYPTMIKWCKNQGDSIFHWEKEELETDGITRINYLFHTKFKPLLKDL